MTKIAYKILNEYGELSSVKGKGRGSVAVSLQGTHDGYLRLSDLTLAIKNGEVRADLRSLPDGIYFPELITSKRTLPLEPLLISGDLISSLPTDDFVIRILLGRVSTLEEKLAALESKQKRLDAEIMGRDPIKELFI